ncbi:hypothetical protein KF840_19485 [bacterium]|nr:hypothetical protein [bacterium]
MTTRQPIAAEADPVAVVSIADEVWIATALLHREHPERDGFTAREITDRARREGITPRLRAGLVTHASQHCVANRPPSPARLRLLFASSRSQRRLFRPGDAFHPGRGTGRTVPEAASIPARYRPLLAWYDAEYAPARRRPGDVEVDPILSLRGLGAEVWQDEPADRYVARLRGGWK